MYQLLLKFAVGYVQTVYTVTHLMKMCIWHIAGEEKVILIEKCPIELSHFWATLCSAQFCLQFSSACF